MDYFISDLHIGHNKPFLYEPRNFISIEEHDKTILQKWNKIITPNDTVYILGDLCMSGDEKEWNCIYKNLNGYKKFIRGNHDTDNKILKYINEYNMEDLGLAYLYKGPSKWKFLLSHYPTIVGYHELNKKFWNLSGHTHSKNKFQYGEHCVYNVAADAHNCIPVSIEQIIKDIKKYKNEKE